MAQRPIVAICRLCRRGRFAVLVSRLRAGERRECTHARLDRGLVRAGDRPVRVRPAHQRARSARHGAGRRRRCAADAGAVTASRRSTAGSESRAPSSVSRPTPRFSRIRSRRACCRCRCAAARSSRRIRRARSPGVIRLAMKSPSSLRRQPFADLALQAASSTSSPAGDTFTSLNSPIWRWKPTCGSSNLNATPVLAMILFQRSTPRWQSAV